MDKPTLPKGTRDFGPAQMAKRQFIFASIRSIFQKFGFLPLETPAMENLSTLTGKYGEEGDQLLFKILNSGDFLKDVPADKLVARDSRSITFDIAEKGLRYDLTVPFARYVVMNRHEITFPFKRYQIQPVWRADRPQKGRYREFYQCDADVVGTDSLFCEVEIILMIREAFAALGITDYSIKINHRGVLGGLADLAGAGDQQTSLFVAIDKLDKIGEEKVKEELVARGFSPNSLTPVFQLLNAQGTTADKLALLDGTFSQSAAGQKGIAELRQMLDLLRAYGASEDHVEFDVALARGLSYYTGCIFEVKIHNVAIGSVCGGGRYDNLTAVFDGKEKSSGVGISFGIDRIYDAMEELQLFPARTQISTKVLIAHFDAASHSYGLGVLRALREAGIASEIYPDESKLKKQLEYADRKLIPYTIVIGPDEVRTGQLTLKVMGTGEQQALPITDIIHRVRA
ncbi:MAG: histidine--tRNA ligase [Cyclobacteriaceae bacterium]|nr:histidine--tRNA ligase [Cyclobacteriaceae bacterium]